MPDVTSVAVIALKDIRENPVALRAVNRESEEYLGLVDSIRRVGLLNPISVRKQVRVVDDITITYYELIDGLHRFSAAQDAGLIEVPVLIKELDNSETIEAQIMANVHKIETRPVEYTKALQRIFVSNPTLTLGQMATKIAKSPAWLSQRLNLLRLSAEVQALVDSGQITVSNAVELAKLPVEEQANYIDQAITMDVSEFVPMVQSRAKELRDAKRQGRSATPAVFVPGPRLRKMSELTTENTSPVVGPQLCARLGIDDAAAGFALGVAWAINLDPVTVEVRKADAAAKKAALDDAKRKRTAERAQKKADDAAAAAAKALAEV